MRWSEFTHTQPRLADLARRRLVEPGVLLVVTIRRDGTPRLSPVEPYLLDGDLWLSMMWGSRKAADLDRDPRILVHNIVTNRDGADGEIKIRGAARAEHDLAVQRRYAAEVAANLGWSPEPGHFHLYALDLADVTAIHYEAATGDQYVTRWPPPAEYVRRATTPTSVGPPEPSTGLLVP